MGIFYINYTILYQGLSQIINSFQRKNMIICLTPFASKERGTIDLIIDIIVIVQYQFRLITVHCIVTDILS